MAVKEKKAKTPVAKKAAVKKQVPGAGATQTTTQEHRINECAMLVRLQISRWHPHATDRKVSDEVAASHSSDASMGKYRKRLLDKSATIGLSNLEHEMRSAHYFLTLPWSDDGWRILSNAGYMAYNKRINELKTKFDEKTQVFLTNYDQYRAEAKKRLNGLYNEMDYPAANKIAGKFGIQIIVQPIPSGSDFRVQVGDAEAKRIRQQIEDTAAATITAAMKDVWGRLQEVVQHAADRLKKYNVTEDGKTEHPFRESLVTNIIELLDIVPALNITGDSNLTQFADDIRSTIACHTATVLRDDAKIRATVANKAAEILSKMSAFLA